MISKMMPPATASEPREKCSSRVSTAPKTAQRDGDVGGRLEHPGDDLGPGGGVHALGQLEVGHEGDLGPTPIRSSRNVSTTTARSIDSKFMIEVLTAAEGGVGGRA